MVSSVWFGKFALITMFNEAFGVNIEKESVVVEEEGMNSSNDQTKDIAFAFLSLHVSVGFSMLLIVLSATCNPTHSFRGFSVTQGMKNKVGGLTDKAISDHSKLYTYLNGDKSDNSDDTYLPTVKVKEETSSSSSSSLLDSRLGDMYDDEEES
jgi:hypothetical protein